MEFAMIGTFIGVFGFLFALYKWLVSRKDKKHEAINNAKEKQRNELNDLQDQRLSELTEKQRRHDQKINALEQLVHVTREEISQNYVRLEQLEKIEMTIEKLELSIDQKLDRLHQRVGSIAKDLNQTIGAMSHAQETQLALLIKDIKNTLEKQP